MNVLIFFADRFKTLLHLFSLKQTPMKLKRRIYIITAIILLLLLPLIAMPFTNEVNWSVFDFVIAAILLFGTGFLCEVVLSNTKKIQYRFLFCGVLLLLLFLVWAELAVGIFGTPFAGS